ncbi:MAG: hypothetical protein IJL40_06005 [Oscillospiraceae bacterium]|nr:hypothetical protein [Oscillospiraceae bacterium]
MAVIACIAGISAGTLAGRAAEAPSDAVEGFFEALVDGDYDKLNESITGVSAFNFDFSSEDANAVLAYNALKASYKFELEGESSISGLDAVQNVRFRYLDLNALKKDLNAEAKEILTEKEAGEKNRRDLYDEDNKLIDSVAEDIFNEAFGRLLENSESYCKEEILSVKARNVRGHWLTVPDSALIKTISGGTVQ